MALTTIWVCLQQTLEGTARRSSRFGLIGRWLLMLCPLLIAGCSAEGDINGTGLETPGNGNGNGYGLNRGAEVSLSPSGLAFSTVVGVNGPSPQTIMVSNSGTGALNWNASTTAGWLSLSMTSGTAPDSFTVTPNIAGLAAGTYSTTIVVSANAASTSTQSLPVDLTISPASTSGNPSPSPTVSVFLSWDLVQDSSVTGYYVHFGMQSPRMAGSCSYTQSTFYSVASLANKSAPLISLGGLTTNTTSYFSVSAYNGKESMCSNEVSTFTQAV